MGRKIVFGTVALAYAAVAGTALAQSMKVKSAAILGPADGKEAGEVVWASGDTVTKGKVSIAFTLHNGSDRSFAGYGYARAGMAELKPGDRVLLFIRDIDFLRHRGQLSGWVAGKQVQGAWKTVTVESVDLTETAARLSVKESLDLTTGSSTKTLDFGIVDGYLRQGVEARPAAPAAATEPAPAATAPASAARAEVTPAVFERILGEKMAEADVLAWLGPGKPSDRPGVPSNMKELIWEGEKGSITIQFLNGRANGGRSSFREPQ